MKNYGPIYIWLMFPIGLMAGGWTLTEFYEFHYIHKTLICYVIPFVTGFLLKPMAEDEDFSWNPIIAAMMIILGPLLISIFFWLVVWNCFIEQMWGAMILYTFVAIIFSFFAILFIYLFVWLGIKTLIEKISSKK